MQTDIRQCLGLLDREVEQDEEGLRAYASKIGLGRQGRPQPLDEAKPLSEKAICSRPASSLRPDIVVALRSKLVAIRRVKDNGFLFIPQLSHVTQHHLSGFGTCASLSPWSSLSDVVGHI